jgi:molybdenum-dependent DNA-binding transcriptional regulator ModE
MYLLSASQGDSKGATAAISAATRALVNLHKRQEKEIEAAKKIDDPNALTIENLDRLVESYAAESEAKTGICLMCVRPKNQEESQNVNAPN